MKTIAEKIRELVIAAKPELLKITADSAGYKQAPESWSKKEILGHLLDSAANNHQRIIRGAQNIAGDFPVYNQNRWVEIQQYNKMDWNELVGFFTLFNFHICRVIELLPGDVLKNPVNIGKESQVNLEFIIKDYLRHLEHHLKKILQPNE